MTFSFICVLIGSDQTISMILKMDICSVADANYLRHYATLLASIVRNNRRMLRFHLITDHLDGPDLGAFKEFCSRERLEIAVHHVGKDDLAGDMDGGRIAKSAYYRLMIPALLPTTSRALYLDTDMVVIGPLDELLAADISGTGAGVVRGYYAQQRLTPFGSLRRPTLTLA